MEQKEIIFLGIVLAAYVICVFTLEIPAFINYTFLAVLVIAISLALLAKYSKKYEGHKVTRIADVLALVFLALFIICSIHEMLYQKVLFVDSAIVLIPFFACLVISWFFKKEEY